jgi:hypothetical protein
MCNWAIADISGNDLGVLITQGSARFGTTWHDSPIDAISLADNSVLQKVTDRVHQNTPFGACLRTITPV